MLTFGAQRSERLERTQDATEAIRRGLLFRQHPQSSDRELTFARLNRLLIANDAPPIPEDAKDPVGTEAVELVARQLFTDAIAASARWPADLDLARSASDSFALLHDLRPTSAAAYTEPLRELLAAWPDQPFAVQGLANHCRQMAAQDQRHADEWLKEAQRLLLRAVELSPGYLPLREQVVAVSKQLGDQATVERETANLHRLAPVVHETGRAAGMW